MALGQNQRPDNVKVLITSWTFYSGSFIMTRSSGTERAFYSLIIDNIFVQNHVEMTTRTVAIIMFNFML